MADVKAYLAIENSVSATMASQLAPVVQALYAKVKPLIEQGRFDDAYEVAQKVSLAGVVEEQRSRIEETFVSALLFGASRLTPLQSTALVQGTIALPQTLDSALDQLTAIVEEDGAAAIREALTRLIGDAEDEFRSGNITLKKAEIFDLAAQLNAAVMGTGKALVDIGANLTTSRLVSFGFLAQANQMTVETYQVSEVLDNRTCPVCAYMHGKTFQVASEFSRVERVLMIRDPNELKAAAPWPKNTKAGVAQLKEMTGDEMQGAGYGSPPYHPLCRGLLMPAGTVTEFIPISGAMTVADMLPKTKPAPKPVDTGPVKIDITDVGTATLTNLIADIPNQKSREQAQKALSDGDVAAVSAILKQFGLL